MVIRKIAATEQIPYRKTRVAVYCRVSTCHLEQEESLAAQQMTYTALIMRNPQWELAGIYSDTRSGLNAEKRSGFMRMINDARDGKIDLILCKSVSRFSRNIVECQRFIETLKKKNVTVVFEKENIRTDQPTSNLVFSLMCAIAQNESKSTSENLQWAYRQKVERGEYNIGSNRIMGYDSVDGKLVPNEMAPVIRQVFKWFSEGRGLSDISRLLEEQGVRRMRSNHPFSAEQIKRILKNETYVGDKLLQKQPSKDYLTKKPKISSEYLSRYLVDDHEPIIDRELWNSVQDRLATMKMYAHRGRRVPGDMTGSDKKDSPLMIFCGNCGSPYLRKSFATGRKNNGVNERRPVWICRERIKGKAGNGCKCRNVRE